MVVAYLITGAVVVGTLGWLLIDFKRTMRKAGREDAALHALPRTPVRDLAEGTRARIVGIAIGHDDYAAAPFSGTPCLAFHGDRSATIVDANETTTTTVHGPASQDVRPFRVEDDTGSIEIAVEHATLSLFQRPVSPETAASRVFDSKLLARDAVSTSYHESLLLPDDRVAVIGTVARGPDGKLHVAGTPDAPLVISNLPAALAP